MNVTKFLQNVRRIADSRPSYRTGGDGSDGTCDCIGLIMGALGGKFDLHSSNYFARFQMAGLERLNDESQLFEGAIVYKDRVNVSQLNARYLPGGRYCNGDLLDYYHVGVVTGVNPIEITHCTSTGSADGIAYDGSIKNWTQFGRLAAVDYGAAEQEEAAKAYVHTADGNPAKLRSDPSTRNPYIAKVPCGAQVDVLESADGWATVRFNGLRGYMMSRYLQETADTGEAESVVLQLNRSTAEELCKALSGALQ